MNSKVPNARCERIKNLLDTLSSITKATCRVYRYVISHKQLTIGVDVPEFGGKDSFFLHFEMVYYFEGPTSWKGADFRLGTKDETLKVIRRTPLSSLEAPGEDEYEKYLSHDFLLLFVLEKPECRVKILGATCEKLSQVPLLNVQDEYFRQLWSWGHEVYEAVKTAITMCNLDVPGSPPDMSNIVKCHKELLGELSALLKRGRWFFPNVQTNEWDGEREARFLGYKQELLSAVANVYWYAQKIHHADEDRNYTIKEGLIKQKKIIKNEMADFNFWGGMDSSSEYWRIMRR